MERLHLYLGDKIGGHNLVSHLSPPLPPREMWMRLPYLSRPIKLLAKELKRYNYRVGFYPLTRVRDLFTLKNRIPPQEKSGIYSLTCACGVQNIGLTGRALSTRLEEHKCGYLSYLKPKKLKTPSINKKKNMKTRLAVRPFLIRVRECI